MTDCQVIGLTIFPIKGCQGIPLTQALMFDEGLAVRLTSGALLHDRQYMIVDETGNFITQREVNAMATIAVTMTPDGLKLSARGTHSSIPNLSIVHQDNPLTSGFTQRAITVWNFSGLGWDLGPATQRWLSTVLQRPASLVQFSNAAPRDCKDIGTHITRTFYADSFPYLILNQQSVNDLQARLQEHHQDSALELPSNRFRSNILIDGLEAYDEDLIATMNVNGSQAQLEVVSKCVRCNVPGIDQQSGEVQAASPTALLDTFRLDQSLGGSTIGVNAMLSAKQRQGALIQVGEPLTVEYAF
jgi:uncharacterized protein